MTCYISQQIAQHCNEEEAFCSECGGNMYESNNDADILECSECGEQVNKENDEWT